MWWPKVINQDRKIQIMQKEEALKGSLTKVYKYLMGGCMEVRGKLSLVVPSNRTRGNGHELKCKK